MLATMKLKCFDTVLITLGILFLVCSGCVTPSAWMPDVLVRDGSGAPIEGAKIVAHSLSMSGLTANTDSKGCARIPSTIQATLWVTVSKTGYRSQWVELNATNPLVVTLERGDDKVENIEDAWKRLAHTNGAPSDPLLLTNSFWKISL